MKPVPPTAPHASFVKGAAIITLMTAMLSATSSAATLSWDGPATGSSWTTLSSWADTNGDDPLAIPGANDDIFFNFGGTNNATQTLGVGGSKSVQSITFNNTGTTTLGGGGNSDIAIGSGGITVHADAGASTLGTTTSGSNIFVRIAATQTWTNNSTKELKMANAATAAASGTTPVTLTISNTSTGTTTFSNTFGNGAGGAVLSLIINSSGTGAVNFGGGTFSGGTTVKSGTLFTSNNFGTGGVALGDTSGSNNAQLLINGSTTHANNFTVNANSGVMSMGFNSASTAPAPTFTGTFTLNQTLLLGSTGTSNNAPRITISGNISGVGGLTVDRINTGNRDASLILGGTNTYRGNTTIVRSGSAFTLADTGSMTFYIGANGVNNSISGAGGLATFDGSFNFDISGASLVDGNSWTIVNVGTFLESFSGTFAVTGFTENSGVWTNGGFTFTEATGILSYSAVPEPSTYAFFAGAGMLLLTVSRRKRVV